LALGADRVRKSPLTVDAVGWTIRNATWPVFPEGKLLKTKRPKTKKACGKCRIRGNPQKTRIPTRCLEKPRKNGSAFPHFPQARRLEQPKNQMHLNTYKGWTRHQEKYREASFDGADGVVVQDQQIFLILSNHPVSGHKVADASFS